MLIFSRSASFLISRTLTKRLCIYPYKACESGDGARSELRGNLCLERKSFSCGFPFTFKTSKSSPMPDLSPSHRCHRVLRVHSATGSIAIVLVPCAIFLITFSRSVLNTLKNIFKQAVPPTTLASDMGGALGSMEHADVKFVADGKPIYAHRAVLSCQSEYFAAMFRFRYALSSLLVRCVIRCSFASNRITIGFAHCARVDRT